MSGLTSQGEGGGGAGTPQHPTVTASGLAFTIKVESGAFTEIGGIVFDDRLYPNGIASNMPTHVNASTAPLPSPAGKRDGWYMVCSAGAPANPSTQVLVEVGGEIPLTTSSTRVLHWIDTLPSTFVLSGDTYPIGLPLPSGGFKPAPAIARRTWWRSLWRRAP